MQIVSFSISLGCIVVASTALAADESKIRLKADISKQEWLTLHKSYAELRSQIVLIENRQFPAAQWFLRFPEQIATDKDAKTGPYQVGMNWMKSTNRWRFSDCPIVGLKGIVSGSVSSMSADTVDFCLTLENHSETVWKRALAWLCFNHSHAKKYYRHRNFVCRQSEIVFTPPNRMEHYCLEGHQRDWWSRGAVTPTKSLIGTECATEDGDSFSTAIAAEKAIMVGQNPSWPCTDIALFFGDCAPGESVTARGKIYFSRGPAAKILRAYERDFE